MTQSCRALSYYSDLTPSQEFQPIAAQLSMKAALPLAKILAKASCRSSNTGPWLATHCSGQQAPRRTSTYSSKGLTPLDGITRQPLQQSDQGGTMLVLALPCTVYPKKYAHGFVVLCFVVVMQSFIMNSHEVFIHIHQGCFVGTGAIVRLPQCQWSKPDGYGKVSQCMTTTKHSKAVTVWLFLGAYYIL